MINFYYVNLKGKFVLILKCLNKVLIDHEAIVGLCVDEVDQVIIKLGVYRG